MSGQMSNRGDQFGRFKRLGDVRLEPCREGSIPIVRACVAGEGDRREKTPVLHFILANPSDECVAIPVWEADVADQDVGPLHLEHIERFSSGGHRLDARAYLREHQCRQGPAVGVVIDDENA